MTNQQKRQGAAGQSAAFLALRMLGIEGLQEIATPVILRPSPIKSAFFVTWKKQVDGDHTGIIPGSGRFVLAETKSTSGNRNLQWSDLKPHQSAGLTEHVENGGLAILVWVNGHGVYCMEWPVPGFGPGKGIDLETAERLDREFGKEMDEVIIAARRRG